MNVEFECEDPKSFSLHSDPTHKTNTSTMLKFAAILTILFPIADITSAFSSSLTITHRTSVSIRTPSSLSAIKEDDDTSISRRTLFTNSFVATTTLLTLPLVSNAETETIVVAGATGQTGRRILERLASKPGVAVIAGVRNVDKASKSLSESSTVVRGAMVQKVPSLDAAGVELRRLDGEFHLVR